MSATAKISVLLADDHTLVRRSLRAVLRSDAGFDLIGEAADGHEAVASARRLRPAVIVMDISLPGLNGIDATRQITSAIADVHILILSMHAGERYVRESLKAGAAGYLLKDAADIELVSAVKAVARGESYFSPAVRQLLVAGSLRGHAEHPAGDALWRLTGREREIAQLVAEGRSTKQIARLLLVSPATIESHRKRLMEKLDLHNVAEIVRFAVRSGLVQ
jgi:DNA-binding NarL/FixJ family response regulator